MRTFAVVVYALTALLVASCGPIYDTKYQFTPPRDPQGKMCATQCQQTQTYCRATCEANRQNCLAYERDRGRDAYEDYVYQRRREHKPIKRTPDSFVNTYNCSNSCEDTCAADYRQCYSTCGGRVTAHQVCTAFCDQPPPQGVIVAPAPGAPPPAQAPVPAPAAKAPIVEKSSEPPSPLCAKGTRVQAYSGNDWYAAVVKAPALPDGRCPVHYDGYGNDEDENVLPSMLRPRG